MLVLKRNQYRKRGRDKRGREKYKHKKRVLKWAFEAHFLVHISLQKTASIILYIY
ncbi:hypothetical protein MY9_2658 [Bacillus sp. JS]|nr:hypothetical protein MY9_2658 [Bacillus sp. JS]